MTRNDLDDVRITTGDEFRALLRELVEKAALKDVDVRGTWEFSTRGSTYNWEVEVVELDKQFDEDGPD